jgi:hypothetical protein
MILMHWKILFIELKQLKQPFIISLDNCENIFLQLILDNYNLPKKMDKNKLELKKIWMIFCVFNINKKVWLF